MTGKALWFMIIVGVLAIWGWLKENYLGINKLDLFVGLFIVFSLATISWFTMCLIKETKK